MTEGFLSSIEAQAKTETERICNELKALKLDANQVITVLNALKLEVPKELRELAPIEVVPVRHAYKLPPLKDEPILLMKEKLEKIENRKERGRKGGVAGAKANKKKSEKTYQSIRGILLEMLAKGPRLKSDILKDITEYSNYAVENAFTRMKKTGEVDNRTRGFQGPSEWFLPSRPVTLEKLRDAAMKVRKPGKVYNTEVSVVDVKDELGISAEVAIVMMEELVAQGILRRPAASDIYTYDKPTGIKAIPASRRYRDRGSMPVSGTGRRAKLSSSKEVQQILAKAEAAGAQTKKQGNDHIRVELGDKVVVLSSSPGDNNRANREKIKDLGISV